jgi:hypothetical protein
MSPATARLFAQFFATPAVRDEIASKLDGLEPYILKIASSLKKVG